MPSPVGHALGGIAAGVLMSRPRNWRYLLSFGLAGALSDLDLILPLYHRGPSHSIGAALLLTVGVLGWQLLRHGAKADLIDRRFALGVGLAVGSHVLLDWLGSDTSAPRGVMAFWPFSTSFYISGLDLFERIERRYWLPSFWQDNALAILRELAILVPLTWLAMRTSRPGASDASGTHAA